MEKRNVNYIISQKHIIRGHTELVPSLMGLLSSTLTFSPPSPSPSSSTNTNMSLDRIYAASCHIATQGLLQEYFPPVPPGSRGDVGLRNKLSVIPCCPLSPKSDLRSLGFGSLEGERRNAFHYSTPSVWFMRRKETHLFSSFLASF